MLERSPEMVAIEAMNSLSVERFAAISFDMATGPNLYARPSWLGSVVVVMVHFGVAPSDDVKGASPWLLRVDRRYVEAVLTIEARRREINCLQSCHVAKSLYVALIRTWPRAGDNLGMLTANHPRYTISQNHPHAAFVHRKTCLGAA
jgi:hypothetical protein